MKSAHTQRALFSADVQMSWPACIVLKFRDAPGNR